MPMIETVEEYVARITGLVGQEDPWIVLGSTPDRLESLVEGASAGALQYTTSAERWSVTRIVAHLADSEIVGAWRFRSVLAQDGTALQGYDQNAWASAFNYMDTDPMESVALFGALRASTLRVLRAVDRARLEHAGMHEERGREAIPHLMRLYAGHDLNHLAQIERLLAEARLARA